MWRLQWQQKIMEKFSDMPAIRQELIGDFMDLFVKTCGQCDFLGKKSIELEDIFSSHYLTK